MGGVTGDAMLKLPLLLVGGHLGTVSRIVLVCDLRRRWRWRAFVIVARLLAARRRAISPNDIHREAEEFEEDEERASISLGWLVHLLLSAEGAALDLHPAAPAATTKSTSARRGPNAAAARAEPRMRRAEPEPEDEVDEYEEEEEEERRPPRARRASSAAAEAAQVQRRLRAAAAQHPGRSQGQRQVEPEHRGNRGARRGARKRAGRFRRQGRDHQRAPRPGGDALRTRARARHQVLARDRSCRRHRALDERGVRPRRRGAGPQRHRHRTAERISREGLFPRIAVLERIQQHAGQAAALSRQDHRRRTGGGRSRAHAASSDRRHHRLRQVGRDQHHAAVAALQAAAGSMPADHDRSEDARTFRL